MTMPTGGSPAGAWDAAADATQRARAKWRSHLAEAEIMGVFLPCEARPAGAPKDSKILF